MIIRRFSYRARYVVVATVNAARRILRGPAWSCVWSCRSGFQPRIKEIAAGSRSYRLGFVASRCSYRQGEALLFGDDIRDPGEIGIAGLGQRKLTVALAVLVFAFPVHAC